MKKTIAASLCGLFILGAFTLNSCVKSFTCECSYDNNGTPETIETDMPGYTKIDATNSCDVQEVSLESSGYTNVSCSLK